MSIAITQLFVGFHSALKTKNVLFSVLFKSQKAWLPNVRMEPENAGFTYTVLV